MHHNNIGIIGGGQLGRMLTLAAAPLGCRVTVLDPSARPAAADVCRHHIQGDLSDLASLLTLADQSDVITYEIESIDPAALREVAGRVAVFPAPAVLEMIQDKLVQKQALESLGIPVAPYIPIPDTHGKFQTPTEVSDKVSDTHRSSRHPPKLSDTHGKFQTPTEVSETSRHPPKFQTPTEVPDTHQLLAAGRKLGWPVILKARRGGFDGRGNWLVSSAENISGVWNQAAERGPFLVEKCLNFQQELAVVVCRSRDGKVGVYDPVTTIHRDGICAEVRYPTGLSVKVDDRAREIAEQIITHLGGVGVFAVEFFLLEDDELVVNEVASRVHNSGHLTQDLCGVSQFEQHIRAICGLPLGSTDALFTHGRMINILGEEPFTLAGARDELAKPGTHLHWYDKGEARPGRKMGHINIVGSKK